MRGSTNVPGVPASIFAKHTSNKSNPHAVTKDQVGLGNVPNVATNDQTPTYSAASTLATLTSGEKLSVSMGKIMKAITEFISHKGSTSNPHGVTKSQVGLGNVENKSASTILGEMTKGHVVDALGYTPPENAYTHPSYTARTGVPTADAAPAFGGSFNVSQPVSDATGHITAMNNRKVTIPSAVATQTAPGLQSAADKKKLDGIADGANKTTVDSVLSTSSTNPVQNKVVKAAVDQLSADIAEALNTVSDITPEKIGATSMKLLWENASPTSEFAAQNVTGDSAADFFAIVTTDGNGNYLNFAAKGHDSLIMGLDGSHGRVPAWRLVSPGGTNVWFNDAYYSATHGAAGTKSNTLLVPVKVYGVYI